MHTPDPSILFRLIKEQAKALTRASEIGVQMKREFAGVLCLECKHEAHLHTLNSSIAAVEQTVGSMFKCGGAHGAESCDCPGLKLQAEDDLFTASDTLFAGFGFRSVCTRAQLIAEGELIDVSEMANEAGILDPVALTVSVYADCVEWTDHDKNRKREYQDQSGRLWDLLCMLAHAIGQVRDSGTSTDSVTYQLLRVPREGDGVLPLPVTLNAIVGQGDQVERVITVLFPNEY
jgi:hypothetical protein